MSFSGIDSIESTKVITNDGFWPDMGVGDFQRVYRLPEDYAEDLLADHLMLGMLWANKEVAEWKTTQQAAGYATLQDVPEDVQGGSIGKGTAVRLHYIRAVSCYAKAILLEQYPTINRREAAKHEAAESKETHERFMVQAQNAIDDLMGRSRCNVELI